jgi:hypothetical protein
MHRTNLYLTDEQERGLDARARAAGISRSELVRRLVDRELERPTAWDAGAEEAFRLLADAYPCAVGGLFDDDADLRIET